MASSAEADRRSEPVAGRQTSVSLWERLLPRIARPASGPGAIVLGGDYRGLGVVRSLGRKGIPVWVCTDEHTLAGTSKYATRRLRWPPAEAEQIDTLLELATEHGLEGWVVFPTGDKAAAMLAKNHAAFEGKLRLTVPDWPVFRWAHDKRLTYELAGNLGLAYPWTRHPRDLAELEELDCPFPIILKPAIKDDVNRFTQEKAWLVEDREALLSRYREASAMVSSDLVMLQEYIPGGGETQLSFAALCQDGEVLASMVARRTRQYPKDFGMSSSYVESVECRELEQASSRLIKAIDFTGLVELEFKYDARERAFKLLDINPRVWGWHSIGRRAGVDFPYLYWQLLQGTPVGRVRGRAGVRWVRAVTDVPAVAQAVRHRELSIADYFRSLRGPLESAIWAADDPAPALLEVPLLSLIALKRRRSH
jgi:predicted ATP-grasp superfamily ATP-dependent carboligase